MTAKMSEKMPDYNAKARALAIEREMATRQNQPSPVHNEKLAHVFRSAAKASRKMKDRNPNKKTFNPFAVLGQADMLRDMPFFVAFGFTTLKEFLDPLLAITFIMPWVLSLLDMIFNAMMMQLAKFSEKVKIHSRFTIKVMLLLAGFVFDSLPGLGFLPISLAAIIIVYLITLWDRANAEKNAKSSE